MKFLLTISICFCTVLIYSAGKAQATKISLNDTEDDVYEEEVMLKDLTTRFPELGGVDKKQVIMMMVWDLTKPSHSKMLLLPDGRLISLRK
jgi:hypothetical protein